MSDLKIYPLHVGTFVRYKMTFGHWLEPGNKYEFPLIGWYVEGADKKIVVDTGGPDPASDPSKGPYFRDDDLCIKNALRKIGVGCEEIDTVVLTHLHWDHSGGLGFFPNAEIIVQQKELESARLPPPLYSVSYIKDVVSSDSFTLVSGDTEIVKGVTLFFTPGHTYGSQGLLIEAENNRYFISGDTFGLFECIDKKPPLISGVYVDLEKYYQSIEKILGLSAFILPGHDFKVFDRKVYS